MTKVTAQMSVSLDGFYTGPRDTRRPDDMSGWMETFAAAGAYGRSWCWTIAAPATTWSDRPSRSSERSEP